MNTPAAKVQRACETSLRMAHILRMMKASAMNRCGWPRARGSEFDGLSVPKDQVHEEQRVGPCESKVRMVTKK